MVKRKFVAAAIFLLAVTLIACALCGGTYVAKAGETDEIPQTAEQGEASPRLFTSLSLSIGGENGYVRAWARNDFTLGFATVVVYVELYSSVSYQESHTAMTLESRNNVEDLNIFETLETKAPTNGVQRYWKGRMLYKIDNGAWKESLTAVWLFDGNGNVIK